MGDTEQLALRGAPLQPSRTGALNPNKGAMLTVKETELPATTLAEEGVVETAKSAPPPPRATSCGLVGALSVIVSWPVRLPAAVGVNVTSITQLAPAAKLLPQVLSCAKSPLTLMPAIRRTAVPVLLRVTACAALAIPTGWLEKVKLAGVKLATGAGRPFPARRTVCGLSAALSVMTTEP